MRNEDLRRVVYLFYTYRLHSRTLSFTALLASSNVGLSSAICLTEPNVELNFLDLKVDTSRRYQTAIKRLPYALAALPIENVIHMQDVPY